MRALHNALRAYTGPSFPHSLLRTRGELSTEPPVLRSSMPGGAQCVSFFAALNLISGTELDFFSVPTIPTVPCEPANGDGMLTEDERRLRLQHLKSKNP